MLTLGDVLVHTNKQPSIDIAKDMIKRNFSIIELLAAFHVLLLMLSYTGVKVGHYFNYLAYVTGAVLLAVVIDCYGLNLKVVVFLITMALIYYLCLFASGYGSYSIPLKITLQYTPLSVFFLKRKKLNPVIWGCVVAFIVCIVELFWMISSDKYILFEEISRNYISLFMIFSMFIITLVFEQKCVNIPIVFPLMFAVLCILGIGRAGMVSGILYFGFIVLYRTYKVPNDKYRKIKSLLMVLALFLVIVFALFQEKQIVEVIKARFFSNAYEARNDGRMRIYKAYLNGMFASFRNIIWGIKPNSVAGQLNFEIGDNLHSSYIQLHSMFGLFGIIGFVSLITRGIRQIIKDNRYQSLCLLLTYLIRIASDYAICGFLTDVICLYYIFLPILCKRRIVDENRRRNRIFGITESISQQ